MDEKLKNQSSEKIYPEIRVPNYFENEEEISLQNLIKLIFRGLIPIALLFSGLFILYLRYPGWSIIFGLPLVVFGTVFSIYTYDELVNKKGFIRGITTKCHRCGRLTRKIPGIEDSKNICSECLDKIHLPKESS